MVHQVGLILSAALIGSLAATTPLDMAFAQGSPKPAESDLTPEEKAEREARKSCKVAICAAMRNRKPGPDLSCNIIKSWRKEQLDKILSKARASWPWGRVSCSAPLKLSRDMLIKALADGKNEAKMEAHTIHCVVERKDGNADIKFQLAPLIKFENGKAVKASLNWGKIEAPTLVKSAMWTATATDNTFNVLQGMVVEDVNDFVTNKCDEVKPDWKDK